MDFESLPVDLIRVIVSFLTGQEINRLWLTGNQSLNSKLHKLSIIEKYILELNVPRVFQFGSIIPNFSHLKTLIFKKSPFLGNASFVGSSGIFNHHISYLPASLTHLEINVMHNLSIGFVSILPPQLEFFRLENTFHSICDSCISELPRNLTNLSLIDVSSIGTASLSNLPTKLQSLELVLTGIQTWNISHLPSSLDKISISGVTNIPYQNLRNLSCFQKGLVDFKILPMSNPIALPGSNDPPLILNNANNINYNNILHIYNNNNHDNTNSNTLNIHNNSSNRLRINSLTTCIDSFQSFFAKSLDPGFISTLELQCTSNSANCTLTHDNLRLVSSFEQLQYLDLDIYYAPPLFTKLLPRSLKSLKLKKLFTLLARDILELPENLEHLILGIIPDFDDQTVGELPQKLLSLEIPNIFSLTPNCSSRFPPKLQRLIIHSIPELDRDSAEQLPRSLKELSFLSDAFMFPNSITGLPPTLEYMLMAPAQSLTDQSSCFLPHGLTYLNIANSHLLTDASIVNLPRSLTFLDISENINLTDAAILHLPPNLLTLILSRTEKLTDSSVKSLPRKLTNLDLSSCQFISCKACSDLPANLVNLKLDGRNESWNDQNIASLPDYLTSLTLTSNRTLTSACVPFLPRHINNIELASNAKALSIQYRLTDFRLESTKDIKMAQERRNPIS